MYVREILTMIAMSHPTYLVSSVSVSASPQQHVHSIRLKLPQWTLNHTIDRSIKGISLSLRAFTNSKRVLKLIYLNLTGHSGFDKPPKEGDVIIYTDGSNIDEGTAT